MTGEYYHSFLHERNLLTLTAYKVLPNGFFTFSILKLKMIANVIFNVVW